MKILFSKAFFFFLIFFSLIFFFSFFKIPSAIAFNFQLHQFVSVKNFTKIDLFNKNNFLSFTLFYAWTIDFLFIGIEYELLFDSFCSRLGSDCSLVIGWGQNWLSDFPKPFLKVLSSQGQHVWVSYHWSLRWAYLNWRLAVICPIKTLEARHFV